MTSEDVDRLVIEAIGDQWDRWTAHSLDLRKSVVQPPRLERYWSATPDGEVPLDLWLVVEEAPDTHDGYEVVYDPDEKIFGLASTDIEGKKLYIGGYGTLWDTLEGM